MRPDWKDAPDWAKWFAMDENGAWSWYEEKPCISGAEWDWRGDSRVLSAHLPEPEYFQETLESRPEPTNE